MAIQTHPHHLHLHNLLQHLVDWAQPLAALATGKLGFGKGGDDAGAMQKLKNIPELSQSTNPFHCMFLQSQSQDTLAIRTIAGRWVGLKTRAWTRSSRRLESPLLKGLRRLLLVGWIVLGSKWQWLGRSQVPWAIQPRTNIQIRFKQSKKTAGKTEITKSSGQSQMPELHI